MWPVELKEYLFFVCIEDSLRASTKEEITDLQDEITNMKYGQEAILTILLELKTVFKSRNPYPARVERCSNLGIVMLTQKQNGRDQYCRSHRAPEKFRLPSDEYTLPKLSERQP